MHRNLTTLLHLHDCVRLPLQPGWAWLHINDQSVHCYREELSATEAVELFLRDLYDDAPNTLADYDQFKRRLTELESTAQTARGTAIKLQPCHYVVPLRKPTRL